MVAQFRLNVIVIVFFHTAYNVILCVGVKLAHDAYSTHVSLLAVLHHINVYPSLVAHGNVTDGVVAVCVKHGYKTKFVVLFAPKVAPFA